MSGLRRYQALVMGVEATDLSCWVLCSTEAELGDCLEVPKKTGDSCRTESGGQGNPLIQEKPPRRGLQMIMNKCTLYENLIQVQPNLQ